MSRREIQQVPDGSDRNQIATRPTDLDSQEIAMNSIHRLGVTIAGLATVLTVAGAFVAQGYVAAQQASAQATAEATAQAAASAPQIVYINPMPTAPPAPPTPSPEPQQVIHVIVGGGGDDGGGDDG
jgi:hypothetical protein